MATSESKKSVEDNVTERLMNALISKMENMDRDIQVVREENAMLRKAFDNPQSILRKAGFVPYTTPLSNDVMTDVFRGDMDVNSGNLMKQDEGNPDKYSNEQIHEMDWDEIHAMADQHKTVKEMY
jgi:hypothetical protein|tara:strand:+ start:2381 stop:2755 length:375 start_codon:yes stop_codon:yes gene_type:complete